MGRASPGAPVIAQMFSVFWLIFLLVGAIVIVSRVRAARTTAQKPRRRTVSTSHRPPPLPPAPHRAPPVPVSLPRVPPPPVPLPPVPLPPVQPPPEPPPPALPVTPVPASVDAPSPRALDLAPILEQIARLSGLDAERADLLQGLEEAHADLVVEVREVRPTTDFDAEDAWRVGRTVLATPLGSKAEVALLLPETENPRSEALIPGSRLHFQGRWVRWDPIYDRGVLQGRQVTNPRM